jgi:ABC-type transporter Mla subunit MlaD
MSPQQIQSIVDLSHWVIGGLLVLALLAFLLFFCIPAWRVSRALSRSKAKLAALKSAGPVLDLEAVAKQAMDSPALQHAWAEYQDTLHPQHGKNVRGEHVVVRWRATATANTFFTDAHLVDTPLRTEFFKHLPGILTGVGIIGTFSGLIFGLMGFKVSSDATAVQASLQGLLNAVGGAFVVSAAAIFLAMLTTLVEKLIISRLYGLAEGVCSKIDGLFDSGAGEEYLARLVAASETSATQAQHIKDALVTDLKGILTELTERQMSAITTSNAQLGQQISTAVTDTLKGPLENISEAVKNVAGQQGDAVNKLLTDVLASFAGRMESMFGGQLGGMNELLKQTATTMQSTAQQFEALALKIEQAGSGATDKMAQKMEELMRSVSERQAESNAQMAEFMTKMRAMVSEGTSQNAELMQGTFTELSQITAKLVNQIGTQSTQATQTLQRDMQAVSEQMTGAVAQQQGNLDALAQGIKQAAETMQDAVTRMRAGVDDNVTRMAGAAERLDGAAGKLTASLQAMSKAADAVDAGIENLTDASKSLNVAVTTQNQSLGQQKEVRDAIGTMVAELRRVVENATRDASVNDRLIRQMESAAERLISAQQEADKYLEGVSDTLAEAHQAFANTVSATLQRGNADFHQELGRAIDMLRTAIQDLGDVFDSIPASAGKR